jgi:hypothetical protein
MMSLLDWFDKRRQNDRAVAELLKQQAEDTRPLHERLQAELDNDRMPESRFILMSKAMIAEVIRGMAP